MKTLVGTPDPEPDDGWHWVRMNSLGLGWSSATNCAQQPAWSIRVTYNTGRRYT